MWLASSALTQTCEGKHTQRVKKRIPILATQTLLTLQTPAVPQAAHILFGASPKGSSSSHSSPRVLGKRMIYVGVLCRSACIICTWQHSTPRQWRRWTRGTSNAQAGNSPPPSLHPPRPFLTCRAHWVAAGMFPEPAKKHTTTSMFSPTRKRHVAGYELPGEPLCTGLQQAFKVINAMLTLWPGASGTPLAALGLGATSYVQDYNFITVP
eukprot:361082-Chlamydomonas_euryale.AAC.15